MKNKIKQKELGCGSSGGALSSNPPPKKEKKDPECF
jgi:hypothetical protein